MNILIVDDEKISRKVLLKQLEGIGNCTSVDDSEKALELVETALKKNQPYDLITLDVSMPKMNGQTVLKRIREMEKARKVEKAGRMKIIMVTSRMNISTIKKCIKLGCSGYLSKPVNKYQLLGNLGKMGFTDLPEIADKKQAGQAQVVAKIIKRFYAGKITLPVLPGIVSEVQDLLEQASPSIDQLTEIVKKDIIISSKLVFIANSALYRGMEKADSLNAALIRLGIKAASTLISSLVAKDLFASEDEKLNALLQRLWMHSFACACLAKRLGEELKMKSADTLFLMGIVHDIGKMLLIKAIADIDSEESFEDSTYLAIHEIHTTFGAVLLKKMRFSEEFVRIAEFHHWNDFSGKDEQELMIINLADHLADQMGYPFFDGDFSPGSEEADSGGAVNFEGIKVLKHVDIEEEKLTAIVNEMKTTIEESAKAF